MDIFSRNQIKRIWKEIIELKRRTNFLFNKESEGGSSDVKSVTGVLVDNTDPSNPKINNPTWNQVSSKPAIIASGDTEVEARASIGAGTSDFTGSYLDLSEKPTLFSGKYTDLSELPTLGTASEQDIEYFATATQGNLANSAVQPSDLSAVATSGSYSDLSNKPTLFSGDYDDLTNKPALFSGSYNDLSDKPTLFSGSYNDLSDTPDLATVATSGSYNDLDNVPTDLISGVNVGKITISDVEPVTPVNNDIWIDTSNPAAPTMSIRIDSAWAPIVGGA